MRIMYRLCYRRFGVCLRKSTDGVLALIVPRDESPMKKSDVTSPECGAGYRRIELISGPGDRGEFRCLCATIYLRPSMALAPLRSV
jgi:hypothetical protein